MSRPLALVLTVPDSERELASDALWSLGVAAVEERDGDAGFVELWTSLGDDPDAVTREAEAFPARWRWHVVELDPSVSESWRQHAQPTWVEHDLVIVPSWLDVAVDPSVLRLDIDPGAAFGLGDHPTTILSARLLRAVLWPGATVLDIGTGSGVLAVLAARLGAPYVKAVDISPAAVEATIANAARNDVATVIDASAEPVAAVGEPFDVVVANLLAPILIDVADDLKRLTAPAGALVVSGILESAHGHVLDALVPLRPVETVTKDGWTALLLRH